MIAQSIINLLQAVSRSQENPWELSALSDVASRNLPDALFGEHATLLRGDMGIIWARWFLEGICDPQYYVDIYHKTGYPKIFGLVLRRVRELFPNMPQQECIAVSRQAARMIDLEVSRRITKKRVQPSKADKLSLWTSAMPSPRCYVCGSRFSKAAEDFYLGRSTAAPATPKYIDYIKLRGTNERHMRVEIDHVVPVAQGGLGGGNFRLACGWCNLFKSSKSSIYDDDCVPLLVHHPQLGKVSIPRPFWIVRTLLLRGRCEWPGGCSKTTVNSELTIVSRRMNAAMNPTNLKVTCLDHDDQRSRRFVPASIAAAMRI
jgi:hypothetical protein